METAFEKTIDEMEYKLAMQKRLDEINRSVSDIMCRAANIIVAKMLKRDGMKRIRLTCAKTKSLHASLQPT